MFRFRSIRTIATKVVVVISIIVLLIALLTAFLSVSEGGHISGSFGSFALHSIAFLISVILLLVLLFANYAMVYKQVGWLKFGARSAAILLAIVEIALGVLFLGNLVIVSGVLLFVAWIILAL